MQTISPQHSVLFAQVPPASSQHAALVGLVRQESPEQHCAAVVHAAAAAVQVPATGPHVPALHARPAEHCAPVVQQGCPLAPQVTAAHAEAVQLWPVGQAFPHAPQLRASVVRSTQTVPQQLREPVHAVPVAQHA